LGTNVVSRPLSGRFVLLGTGTSVGVPTIGCGCEVCQSADASDKRTRCAAIVGMPEGNLLIDTPPDLRQQLLRESIGIVHAVAYTHQHADHLFGLDDLRLFPFYIGGPVPLYCEAPVEQQIRKSYDYAFADIEQTHVGAVPQLTFQPIGTAPVSILGGMVQPIRLKHGPRFEVLGFRIGNIAYCTDTNAIPAESLKLLEGLDYLILDALRPRPHPTHFSLQEAIDVASQIGAKQTYFTHISHELGFASTNAMLPAGMQLAYDGLELPLTLATSF
jgi:phosphoribosyl 1,2-cyclic phosphate phosphodiesterase